MKVQVFCGDELPEIVNRMNEFLSNLEILPRHILQSQSSYMYQDDHTPPVPVTVITYSIFYEDNPEQPINGLSV